MTDLDDEARAARAAIPGARRPDRRWEIAGAGVRLTIAEWGDPNAPPVLVAHGGVDLIRTLDGCAPMLADAGWRVIGWDQRGHGESSHADLYSWDADLRDAVAVLDAVATAPIPVVGHSKG